MSNFKPVIFGQIGNVGNIESNLQMLRRHRRPLLLRVEYLDRPTVENHVHRQPRMGNSMSANLRLSISLFTGGVMRSHGLRGA